MLGAIRGSPWYIRNENIGNYFVIPFVKTDVENTK